MHCVSSRSDMDIEMLNLLDADHGQATNGFVQKI